MKKILIASILAAGFAGSAMACQSCGVNGQVAQSAKVSGSNGNIAQTYAGVAGTGTSKSTAISASGSAAVAGGVQSVGTARLPLVGSVVGAGAVIGAATATGVVGTASNHSTGNGVGFGYSAGYADASAKVKANGSVERNDGRNSGSGSFEIAGKATSWSEGATLAGTNQNGSYVAGTINGVVAAGGVAVENCNNPVNFAGGATVDVKGGISYAGATNGYAASSGTVTSHGSYEVESDAAQQYGRVNNDDNKYSKGRRD